jgi:hypothetical protein
MENSKNLELWEKLRRPPVSALKTITGGRLSGFTDVNPNHRYQAMTELFGPCGVGWKYSIDKLWNEPGCDGVVFAFAQIQLCVMESGQWSEPIPGIGGSRLIEKEKSGMHANDEGYKMAVTDALSVAMKMLGMAADIYAGLWDGSKYIDQREQPTDKPAAKTPEKAAIAQKPKGTYQDRMTAAKTYLKGLTGEYEIYDQALIRHKVATAGEIKDKDEQEQILKELLAAADDFSKAKKAEFPPEV